MAHWQIGKGLAQCLDYMLTNEISTDVTFDIRPRKVHAHRLLLCARSPVFEAMFSGKFKEREGCVTITDSEPEPFIEMLRYIYTDDVKLNGNNVIQIRHLAQKYILEDLEKKCEDYLKKCLSTNNVCDILNHSVSHSDELLIEKCLELCASSTTAVAQSESFKNMSHEALLAFIRYDRLDTSSEEYILKACIEWAETKQKGSSEEKDLRDILGDCIYEIRFLQIPEKNLASIFGRYTVLNETEKNLFLISLLTNENDYVERLHGLGFNIYSRLATVERSGYFTNISLPSPHPDNEIIHFSVNKKCLMSGVSVFAGEDGRRHDVLIELKENSVNTELGTIRSSFTSSGNILTRLKFPKEICIDPGKSYVLNASLPLGLQCYFCSSDTNALYLSNLRNFQFNYQVQKILQSNNTLYAPYSLGYIKNIHLFVCSI